MMPNCPLCGETEVHDFYLRPRGNQFLYLKCTHCALVFVNPSQRITGLAEKERYLKHLNNLRSPGYEAFLLELLNPLKSMVDKKQSGLDFGSGPYPMLCEVAKDYGLELENYDPFFCNDEKLLKRQYNFITSCEVVEHFHDPCQAWSLLVSLIGPMGYLAVKTSVLYPEINFENWYYKEDDTHVVFYSPKTLDWISHKYHLKKVYFEKNVIIWQRS